MGKLAKLLLNSYHTKKPEQSHLGEGGSLQFLGPPEPLRGKWPSF